MKTQLRVFGTALATASIALLTVIPTALATNPNTISGNFTTQCAVNWKTRVDLSSSLTQDYNNNGTIESEEVYSNQGYLQEVSSRADPTWAAHGPGDFLIHHWWNNSTSLGFRLPVATDYDLTDVNAVIHTDSSNWELGTTFTPAGLTKYTLIDGNSKYLLEAPAPQVTAVNGELHLHWDFIPAGSANIYYFSGSVTDGSDARDVVNHYLAGAELTATYSEGDATCPAPTAPLPITWEKHNETGTLLSGATLAGLSCTRTEPTAAWVCTDLSTYSWFSTDFTQTGTTADHFIKDITVNPIYPNVIKDCVVVWEKTAPNGYIPSPAPMAVCATTNGWEVTPSFTLTKADYPLLPSDVTSGLGTWKTSDKKTFTLTNAKVTPTATNTPTATVTASTSPTVTVTKTTTPTSTETYPPYTTVDAGNILGETNPWLISLGIFLFLSAWAGTYYLLAKKR